MINTLSTDFYNFDLPESLIAQKPCDRRDEARLLHSRDTGIMDRHIFDLPNILRAGDFLVLNNTKVIPARLRGRRKAINVEILLHRKVKAQYWLAFARPGKKLQIGDQIDFSSTFSATLIEKRDGGEILIAFSCPDSDVFKCLEEMGEPPLPPYIQRDSKPNAEDRERYQTVFAQHQGSVAAPTAGLHFTHELLEQLRVKGISHHFVTLHVGAGTFMPVKAATLNEHKMHSEHGEITNETARIINQYKKEGRRLVAVGTTTLRLLESAADKNGKLSQYCDETNIFIHPGHQFRIVDALITNFHLPKSTLFMLVCAFVGIERAKDIYQYAIKNKYRFYSYGDATLLDKS